jgi:hypothetical protein
MSDLFNRLLDNLQAAGGRILDLPLFMLLGGIVLCGLALGVVLKRRMRRAGSAKPSRVYSVVFAVLGLFGLVLVADRKIAQLQTAITELRSRSNTDAATLIDLVPKPVSKRPPLFDETAAQRVLTDKFGENSMQSLVHEDALDFVRIIIKRPVVRVYIAIVDLKNPAVEIKLDTAFDKKSLTSLFARENGCVLAINGEAGTSPGANSGLGIWRGFMVSRGQEILQENTNYPRPFLSFDRQNHAEFISAAATNRAPPPTRYNVIWGRRDILIKGKVQLVDSSNRQPRTAMAINQEGTKLYLLVADGRQAEFSQGMTFTGIAQCLQAFGAYAGMACDEGGSSCVYVKQLGGIANIPSDNLGQERPTYTHFGIRIRDAK